MREIIAGYGMMWSHNVSPGFPLPLWLAKILNMLIMRDLRLRPGPKPDDLGAIVRASIAYYQHRWLRDADVAAINKQ